jgi:hypothetical protein
MLVYNTISISDNVLVTVTRWLPSVEKELLTTPGFYDHKTTIIRQRAISHY